MPKKVVNFGDKGDDSLIADGVPETREDCTQIERPCSHLNCRHHLWRDLNSRGKIIFNFVRSEKIRQREIAMLKKRIEEKEEKYDRNKGEEIKKFIEKYKKILEFKLAEIPESCALDVAEDGENSIKRIAIILGIRPGDAERIIKNAVKVLKYSKRSLIKD